MTDRPSNPPAPFGPDLWDVLARYVAGESPANEADAVRRWLAADPARGELVAGLQRSLAVMAVTPPKDIDVEAALRRVSALLAEPDVRPLHAGGRELRAGRWRTMGLRAAAVLALLVGAELVWRATRRVELAPVPLAAARTYTTPVGRTDSVHFADGSLVILGPGSTLDVGAGYGGEIRSVELHGQALFNVVHDERRPFMVRAGSALIEDLGTTFTVRNDEDDSVHVVVMSGSVRLRGRGQGTSKPNSPPRKEQGDVLKGGDRGAVGRDGRPMVERAGATPDDIAWTRGRLIFDNAPLSRVRADVRRWYGVELQVTDQAMAGRHLTASFAGEPVDQVLRVIGLALGARIERRGDTAVVRAR